VQAIQLSSLKTSIATGKVSVGSGSPSSSGAGDISSNVNNLPNMVGGC
jgi:hypothetical protein